MRAALEACFRSDETGWKLGARLTEAEIAGAIGQAPGRAGRQGPIMMTAESARAGAAPPGLLLPPHALPLLGALEVYR